MFKDLFKFSKKRNFLEALGFFIVYFSFDMLLCAIIGITSNILWNVRILEKNFAMEMATLAGFFISLIFCTVMSIAIIIAKRQYKNIYAILSLIITFIVTLSVFDMLGAFLFSMLTMFDDKSAISNDKA